MSKKRTNEEFLNEITKLNPTYSVLSEYINTDTNVSCHCNIHNVDFMSTPYNLLKGKVGCEFCRREKIGQKHRMTTEQFILKMSKINNDIEIIGEYINCKNKIKCNCKIHNEIFYITPDHLIQGETGCKQCINLKNHLSGLKTHDTFINEIFNINPNIIILGLYDGAKKRIKVKCKTCKHIWEPVSTSLVSGFGCPECARKQISEQMIKKFDDFKADLFKYNPNITYIDGYVSASNTVHVRCDICGYEWNPIAKAISNRNAVGCPICCQSHGEKRIISYLSDNKIDFQPQKTFNNLVGIKGGLLSYDFYLPKYQLLIEYQGEFHNGTVHFQTEEKFKSQQEHDRRKRNYAKNNDYKLLEIWYWDFDNIEEILNNTINNLENSVEITV